MLEIRPNCEYCDKDLAADSAEAMICSYECTFCVWCVKDRLKNVCPNCGGGFEPRPIRPKSARRPGLSTQHQPASLESVNTKYSLDEIKKFSESIKTIKPAER